jgi:nucleoid-associated protein YgaU
MATSAQGFVAAAAPTKIERVSNTTLYHLAAKHFGNALLWTAIAEANDMIDPWIWYQTDIIIPNVVPTSTPDGILGL